MIWLHEMLELGNVAPNANYKMERMEERKRRDFYIGGGSHTQVFSIGWEDPWATALMRPSLKSTQSYGNLPYNFKLSLVFQYCFSV